MTTNVNNTNEDNPAVLRAIRLKLHQREQELQLVQWWYRDTPHEMEQARARIENYLHVQIHNLKEGIRVREDSEIRESGIHAE